MSVFWGRFFRPRSFSLCGGVLCLLVFGLPLSVSLRLCALLRFLPSALVVLALFCARLVALFRVGLWRFLFPPFRWLSVLRAVGRAASVTFVPSAALLVGVGLCLFLSWGRLPPLRLLSFPVPRVCFAGCRAALVRGCSPPPFFLCPLFPRLLPSVSLVRVPFRWSCRGPFLRCPVLCPPPPPCLLVALRALMLRCVPPAPPPAFFPLARSPRRLLPRLWRCAPPRVFVRWPRPPPPCLSLCLLVPAPPRSALPPPPPLVFVGLALVLGLLLRWRWGWGVRSFSPRGLGCPCLRPLLGGPPRLFLFLGLLVFCFARFPRSRFFRGRFSAPLCRFYYRADGDHNELQNVLR